MTGEKHVGKSTVLRRLLEHRDAVRGGFLTVRVPMPDGAAIHMLRAGREETFLPENLLFTRRQGILVLLPERFDQLGSAILAERAGCDLLIMDELGPAERDAAAFQRAVLDCLDGGIPVYGVLQKGENAFLDVIKRRPDVQVVTVTEENRELLPRELLEQGW